jgi:MFS family permease
VTLSRLGRTRIGRSLENPNIRRYLVGVFLSHLGTWMQMTAELWLILQITGSGTALGIHSVVRFAPVLLFGAHGGLLTDRVERLKLLKITQTGHMVAASVLVSMMLFFEPSVMVIYAVGLGQGFINAVDNPLRRGFIRDLSSDRELPNAVALNSTLATINRTIGPALGGFTIATLGVFWCFVTNMVNYLAVLVALSLIDRSTLRPPKFAPPGGGQVKAAYNYACSDARIWTTLVIVAVIGTFAWNYGVLMPVYATVTMGGDASLYGLLLSTVGIGSFVGALINARASGGHQRRTLRAVAVVVGAMLLVAAAPNIAVAAVALFILGGAGTSVIISAQTLIQLTVHDEMSGRVMALYSVAFLGSKPLGGLVTGWLIDLSGPRLGFAVGAAAVGVVTLAVVIQQQRAGHPLTAAPEPRRS